MTKTFLFLFERFRENLLFCLEIVNFATEIFISIKVTLSQSVNFFSNVGHFLLGQNALVLRVFYARTASEVFVDCSNVEFLLV